MGQAGQQRYLQDELTNLHVRRTGVADLLDGDQLPTPCAPKHLAKAPSARAVAALEVDLPRLHVPRGPHHLALHPGFHGGSHRTSASGLGFHPGSLLQMLQVCHRPRRTFLVHGAGVEHHIHEVPAIAHVHDVPRRRSRRSSVQCTRRQAEPIAERLQQHRSVPRAASTSLLASRTAFLCQQEAQQYDPRADVHALEAQVLAALLQVNRLLVPRAAQGLRD
mmetsp:Transcript_126588/g.405230  ORF Transcript_126588/g.405230 Transcript_126588/m.405230 type:complete len:221 (-) Transcript_126588:440-1102(-)